MTKVEKSLGLGAGGLGHNRTQPDCNQWRNQGRAEGHMPRMPP